MMGSSDLVFRTLDVDVRVRCSDARLRSLIDCHWSGMRFPGKQSDVSDGLSCSIPESSRDQPPEPRSLQYSVVRDETTSLITFSRAGLSEKPSVDEGQFLYELEADSTIEIQKFRRELYFLHAAVGEAEGKAYLIVAESGGGKSTTLWGMLHQGWRYLSDELAPIDLSTMLVRPYPRALCLKRRPPAGYPLPTTTLETPRTFHVPVDRLPQVSALERCPLAAAYFLKYCPEDTVPSIRPIGVAEAAARLYANSLNQLAHANAGLRAAAEITKSIPSFALRSSDLAATCALLDRHRDEISGPLRI